MRNWDGRVQGWFKIRSQSAVQQGQDGQRWRLKNKEEALAEYQKGADHLRKSAAANPAVPALWVRLLKMQHGLADLLRRSGKSAEAAQPPKALPYWYRHALCPLMAGDLTGYQRLTTRMHEEFVKTEPYYTAWTSVLAANPKVDYVSLAHALAPRTAEMFQIPIVLGDLYYRTRDVKKRPRPSLTPPSQCGPTIPKSGWHAGESSSNSTRRTKPRPISPKRGG